MDATFRPSAVIDRVPTLPYVDADFNPELTNDDRIVFMVKYLAHLEAGTPRTFLGVNFTMSGEMQSILRILGDIQAQNAEMSGRMERLEAEMEAS